jgi:hypothetical protein
VDLFFCHVILAHKKSRAKKKMSFVILRNNKDFHVVKRELRIEQFPLFLFILLSLHINLKSVNQAILAHNFSADQSESTMALSSPHQKGINTVIFFTASQQQFIYLSSYFYGSKPTSGSS